MLCNGRGRSRRTPHPPPALDYTHPRSVKGAFAALNPNHGPECNAIDTAQALHRVIASLSRERQGNTQNSRCFVFSQLRQ